MNRYFTFLAAHCIVIPLQMHASEQAPSAKQQTKPAQQLTLGQSILVGGLVGAAEVAFPGQPLSYAMNLAIKNATVIPAQRQPFIFTHSYKGFAANALGQMPITAAQKAVQAKASQAVENAQGCSLSDWQKAGVSYTAGMAGAVIDTASNAVQLHQQNPANTAKGMLQSAQELGLNGLKRGFVPNAFLKEGPFAVGYQFAAPQITQAIKPYINLPVNKTYNDLAAVAVGGAAAGVATAVVTHPGAVIRNKMQNDSHKTVYRSAWQTTKKVCEEEGVVGLFNGLKQRGTRVAIAVPLYVAYTTLLESKMK